MYEITRRGFALSVVGALALRGQGSEDLADLSLAEASARIRARTVTPIQLAQACLARIEVYNPKLNAFITVMRDHALAQARELESEQRSGKLRSPLHGIPIALKDNIDTAGVRHLFPSLGEPSHLRPPALFSTIEFRRKMPK